MLVLTAEVGGESRGLSRSKLGHFASLHFQLSRPPLPFLTRLMFLVLGKVSVDPDKTEKEGTCDQYPRNNLLNLLLMTLHL